MHDRRRSTSCSPRPTGSAPLRAHDVAPSADGAAAVVLAVGDRAREITDNPVWIRGMDHRIESHHPGLRDLTDSPSTRLAAEGGRRAERHPGRRGRAMVGHSHEEIVLRAGPTAPSATHTVVNPSGGPLAGDPCMATGLVRVAEVARRIAAGDASVALAHASSGPCLQQNLLAVLEGAN